MTPEEKSEILKRCSDDPHLLRIVEAGLGVLEFHQTVAVRAVQNAKKAKAELEVVKAALSDAIELAQEGWGYADDHFYTKWKVHQRLEKVRKALKPTEEATDAVSPVQE